MIPIRRNDGQVVGFGARILDDLVSASSNQSQKPAAKYINSPETIVFKKSNLLFGLDLARRHIQSSGSVLVVEGYFDVLALHDAGVYNVVGVMGTAVSPEQLLTISGSAKSSYGRSSQDSAAATKIVFLLDSDVAGQAAVRRICLQVFNKLPETMDIRIARYLVCVLCIYASVHE